MHNVTLFAALVVLFPLKILAQEPEAMAEILSKDDAQAMFAMTEDQWLANLQGAVASGMAKPLLLPLRGWLARVQAAEDAADSSFS